MINAKKVSDAEVQANPDRGAIGLKESSDEAEVAGRGGKWETIMCWCGALNLVEINDDSYLWYRCWNTQYGVHYFRV